MNTTFSIMSETPSAISEAATQPDPSALSLDELRICFPGRIAMVANGEECIVLDDAPVIGVLVEVAESLLRLKQGAALAEVVDFYGEYKLVFRAMGAAIECENEFAGGKCQTPAAAFRDAAKRWSDDLLAGIEEHYTTIGENPHYQRLKEQVVRTWREQASPN
jgi:hypothetical protein